MAKCPWCNVLETEAWIGSEYHAYCLSSLNPGNKGRGRNASTQSGVVYGRCANGNVVDGLGYKDCPFFKKKATRKRK